MVSTAAVIVCAVLYSYLVIALGSLAGRMDRLTERVEDVERRHYPTMRPRG